MGAAAERCSVSAVQTMLIGKNRLGADKCTGMYAREEDIFSAIYRQLKGYVNEHYIKNSSSKQKIQEFTSQIADLTQHKTTAWINAMEHYEKYVQGEISKEEFRAVQNIANQAKEALIQATEGKTAYEKHMPSSANSFLLAVKIFRQ